MAHVNSHAELPWSREATTATDCTFEQIAPYIGRIKTSIARSLIGEYTQPGELVVDPFAGSGVIPFEAALLGRRSWSGDINSYGFTLLDAKFRAPATEARAIARFRVAWGASQRRVSGIDLRSVPKWVRSFFHPRTLREALALRDELVENNDTFLTACLLGILHHQRPGFLSYPSSHLVPYLRNKKFPRSKFPEMYEYREIRDRMEAKIRRTYRRPPAKRTAAVRYLADARRLPLPRQIDAVVTSPPYMNELDYVRDNRLRLWFLERGLPATADIRRQDRERVFMDLLRDSFARLVRPLRPNGVVAIVVGDSRRGSTRVSGAALVKRVFAEPQFGRLRLERELRDTIPDIRRSRRSLSGTKRETVLVYRCTEV